MSSPARRRAGPVALLFIGIFSLWRLVLSPLLGPSCRFQPSCSAYGIEAMRRHGAILGLWLTLRRLARCHPWGGHGPDPVPDAVRLPFQPAKDRA
jgi:putative membrane protein insertion efficiency factor